MQYQVPQFIETEDKILGPLTLTQFIIVAASLGLGFFLYALIPSTVIAAIVGGIAVLAGVVLALGKINGQKMTKMAFAAFQFYWKPQMYVWQPENPTLPKNERTMRAMFGSGIDLEKIVSGMALRGAWSSVQTGTAQSGAPKQAPSEERFQIINRASGERKIARRVDYR